MKIQTIQLELDSLTLLGIIAGLQLALTHPENNKETSKMMRSFIEQVTPSLAEIDGTYKVLIDAGFARGTDN